MASTASGSPAGSGTASGTPRGPQIRTRRFESRDALLAALEERLEHAIAGASGPRAVMLSGGSTPIPAYLALAKRRIAASPGLHVCFSDDRYVPSTSDASNYHQTRPLIDALRLPEEQVLRVRTELPLDAAAEDYDRRLAALEERGVRLELGLLGLGADGHTASLFSAGDIERARDRRALSVHRPDGRDAVSVSPGVLARVAELVFVVAGADKRAALASLLAADRALTAWQAVSARSSAEVWTEPQALPGEA